MKGRLILQDGSTWEGESFGFENSTSGEVVFSTGMTGYPESYTDPSYYGQILVNTYPLVGNYGVPKKDLWESGKVHIQGLVVSDYIDTPSHFQKEQTLSAWLKSEKVPALEIKDTRALTQKIREKGTMLGKILVNNKDVNFYNPDEENLVEKVSSKEVQHHGEGTKTIVLIDCGSKHNIRRELLKRGVKVITVPWDYDVFEKKLNFNAIVVSNGPGDPKKTTATIEIIKKALQKNIPILGICLGNQLLALAAGGDTQKLKYGHRSQNQPSMMEGSKRCFITTQNHGFEVSKIPPNFKAWFVNANDGSNEGIIHKTRPVMSVQFHPEARSGPTDCNWIFDYFLSKF